MWLRTRPNNITISFWLIYITPSALGHNSRAGPERFASRPQPPVGSAGIVSTGHAYQHIPPTVSSILSSHRSTRARYDREGDRRHPGPHRNQPRPRSPQSRKVQKSETAYTSELGRLRCRTRHQPTYLAVVVVWLATHCVLLLGISREGGEAKFKILALHLKINKTGPQRPSTPSS